jgi:hypothetical protein
MRNKTLFALAVLAAFAGLASADAAGAMIGALWSIRYFFCMIIPALMLVCFLLAAIIYAAGQMTSADQRARFHGWATNLLIGAITCGVMYVLAPWLIMIILNPPSWYPEDWRSCAGV